MSHLDDYCHFLSDLPVSLSHHVEKELIPLLGSDQEGEEFARWTRSGRAFLDGA